ncbi:MAG: hypothetical protein ACXWQO_14865 [Bdellovibrionota bacterium]
MSFKSLLIASAIFLSYFSIAPSFAEGEESQLVVQTSPLREPEAAPPNEDKKSLLIPNTEANSEENAPRNKLHSFFTDGCSSFPDGIPLLDKNKWRKCCIEHDVVYWQGGTAEDRKNADAHLGQCVANRAGKILGGAMYLGVRIGGYEALPTTWHWGYGWAQDRGYAPLNSEEKRQVQALITAIPKNLEELPNKSPGIVRSHESFTGNNCLDEAILEIEKTVPHKFQIESLEESDKEKAEGFIKTMILKTDACSEPFKFTFLLLRRDACIEKLNEVLARTSIRLKSVNKPNTACK